MNNFKRLAVFLFGLVFLCSSILAHAQKTLDWKTWGDWDHATRSYVPIDSTIESRNEVFIAKAVLKPELPPFMLVHRRSADFCGSAGCSLDVFAPVGGSYAPFQSWIVDSIEIRNEKLFNGWHPIALGNNTWVYEGGEYKLR